MENLESQLQTVIKNSTTNVSASTSQKTALATNGDGSSNEDGDNKWGLPLRDLYRFGLNFYKDKSGKAVHLSYEDNLKFIAFTQQAAHGPINVENTSPLGVLDVIGRDRRIAWQQLGTISKAQAMEGFIDLLDRLCPLFKPYVEAIKKDREEKQRIAAEEERKHKEQQEYDRQQQEQQLIIEEKKNREEIQKRHLQDILNQQTFYQFKAYAEKQYAGNPEQQAVLIKQLQTEHYHQYMAQLHAQAGTATNNNDGGGSNIGGNAGTNSNTIDDDKYCTNAQSDTVATDECQSCNQKTTDTGAGDCDSDTGENDYPVINPASMWTRPDIQLFKQEVSAGKGDGVIRIGHGDTVTVRVPTHDGGNCLFWEFATDSYDVGFGVYFEWGKSASTEVSVHISESDDDEDALDDDDEVQSTDDLESGGSINQHRSASPPTVRNQPLITSIVPVYRRECQNEVYVGSHNYPGEGVYLLKFDNSYSLWRSKTLYYRVYYTR